MILEDLQKESLVNNNSVSSDESRIGGYFCSNIFFQFK